MYRQTGNNVPRIFRGNPSSDARGTQSGGRNNRRRMQFIVGGFRQDSVFRCIRNIDYGNGIQTPLIEWKNPPTYQTFALPSVVMEHIALNPPSLEVYLKLIRSCKYFFAKNPLFVLENLGNPCKGRRDPWTMNNLKLWIVGSLIITRCPPEHDDALSDTDAVCLFSNICKRLYRCDVDKFELRCKLDIDFGNLRLCVQKARFISIYAPLIHGDGRRVRLEELIAAVPNVEVFEIDIYGKIIMDNDTLDELIKLETLPKIGVLKFYDVPHTINLDKVLAFLKKHRVGKCQTLLHFGETINDLERSIWDLLYEIEKVPGLKCTLL